MEENAQEPPKLYSQDRSDSTLVYPTYIESKRRFKKAHKTLKTIVPNLEKIDENAPLENRVEFVKAFQELNNSYEALVTYNEHSHDMEKSKALQDQVIMIEETVGVYNTVKGSIIDEEDPDDPI